MPNSILKSDQRWRRQCLRWLRSLDTINDQTGDVDFSVRVIRIAFSISTEQCRTRSGNLKKRLDHSLPAQIVHQQIALGIDIGPKMMGDLTRIVAKAHAAVKRDRAEPDRTAIGSLFEDQPKPDMMSLVGAPSIWFLKANCSFFPS